MSLTFISSVFLDDVKIRLSRDLLLVFVMSDDLRLYSHGRGR